MMREKIIHQYADVLIDWLASTPYRKPARCPWCIIMVCVSHKRGWSDLNARKPDFLLYKRRK